MSDATATYLGLPAGIAGCLFDMDGVLTNTARTHEAAWAEVFDGVLRAHAAQGRPFAPFTHDDYLRYVDGRRREDGTAAFLESRHLEVPRGDEGDDPAADT